MLGTQDMPAIKQAFKINDRIEAYLKFIGRKLEEQPFTPPYTYRGKNYNTSAIIGTAIMRWAEAIESGEDFSEERLKTYLVEYLYLTYVDDSRSTKVYINDQIADRLDLITDYLMDYPSGVPLLRKKGRKNVNNRLVIVFALLKLAEDLGFRIPKMLPPTPGG